MSSPIAFSITHAQIDAMRELPVAWPTGQRRYLVLIAKGLAAVQGAEVVATPAGVYLRQALTGLALSKRPS